MQRTPELLRLLLEAEVEFVVIGGVAAIAHGSVKAHLARPKDKQVELELRAIRLRLGLPISPQMTSRE